MRQFLFPLAILTLVAAGTWSFVTSAADADDILPPPEVSDSAVNDADAVSTDEKAPNLQDELKSPETSDDVEVRAYQRKDGAKISEYSSHGHVYMVKVQPAGGLPAYYLYDENGDGQFERRLPGGYKRISPPSWVIKRF